MWAAIDAGGEKRSHRLFGATGDTAFSATATPIYGCSRGTFDALVEGPRLAS
jgi:hypothetical protein